MVYGRRRGHPKAEGTRGRLDRRPISNRYVHGRRMWKKDHVLPRKKVADRQKANVFYGILWKMLLYGVEFDLSHTARRRQIIAQGAILNWLDWASWTRLINRDLWGKMRFFLIFIVR